MTSTAAPARRPGRAAALPPEERRAAIVAATLPLLLEHGERVTTRQIADAAGIAEGTIFRVFDDKDAVIAAVVDAIVDPAPLDSALAAIDTQRPLADVLTEVVEILQRRVMDVFRLLSAIGPRLHDRKRPPADSPRLTRLLASHRDELALPPARAARHLRSVTLALTHPMLVDQACTATEIVDLFLHGVAKEPRC